MIKKFFALSWKKTFVLILCCLMTIGLSIGTAAAGITTSLPAKEKNNQISSSILTEESAPGIITTAAGGIGTGNQAGGAKALGFRFGFLSDLVFDQEGNLFILDQETDCVYMMDVTGVIAPVAGTGKTGSPGDGGPALQTPLGDTDALAVDSQGNIYIALGGIGTVMKVDKNGNMTRFAGGGTSDSDGIRAVDARMSYAFDLACDSQDNLYILDIISKNIKKVDKDGIISTIAGRGVRVDLGNGLNTEASLPEITFISIDRYDNLYVASELGYIFRIDTRGVLTKYAGKQGGDELKDNIPALSAGVNCGGISMAFDSSNNMYITQFNCVRRINSTGTIKTITGNHHIGGYSGDGGPAIDARLDNPAGLACDKEGNLYISDSFNHRIRRIQTAPMLGNEGAEISAENRFLLELWDGPSLYYQAVFSEMSDLRFEIEKVAGRSASKDGTAVITNGRTNYYSFKLRRELAAGSKLLDWVQKVDDNTYCRKNGFLTMYDKQGNLLVKWQLQGVWPSGLGFGSDEYDDERYMEEVELTIDRVSK